MEIVIALIAAVALIIFFVGIRNRLAFYTKTNCSVCGEATGFKGNKRFKLSDGHACQSCVSKTMISAGGINTLGPNALAAQSVQSLSSDIRRRAEIGDEQWAAEKTKQTDERMAEIQAKIRENSVQAKPVDNIPKCPKCRSTSISADKKGFGVGKAVMGAAVAGPVGLVAGNIGAKKVRITCLNCGHHWEAGKA